MTTEITVELLHTPDCANLEAARSVLEACISEFGRVVTVVDREGAYPSPTILVNGADVMGRQLSDSPACRLDVPTRQRILEALQAA